MFFSFDLCVCERQRERKEGPHCVCEPLCVYERKREREKVSSLCVCVRVCVCVRASECVSDCMCVGVNCWQ